MANELKPCPFCGSTNLDCGFMTGTLKGFDYVACEDCGGEIHAIHMSRGIINATDLWNRRTEGKEEFLGVCPSPCVRDEHGEIKKQPVKALLAKVDEELTELKEAIFRREAGLDRLDGAARGVYSVESAKPVALEAADTITAITTMLEALGIDAKARDEAQRRVNEKNRERGRL